MQRMIENKSSKFGQRLFASFALVIAASLSGSTTVSAYQTASNPPSTQTSQQATDDKPKDGEWRVISPTDALATFMLPKKPKYVERTFPPVSNKPPVKVHLYRATVNDGKESYVFGYHDLHKLPVNAAEINRILEGAVRGSVGNVEGELLSNVTEIRFKKYPGRQFNYRYKHGEELYVVLARVFVVGQRQYQITSLSHESAYNEKLATNFLNSFKLVVLENDEPPVP